MKKAMLILIVSMVVFGFVLVSDMLYQGFAYPNNSDEFYEYLDTINYPSFIRVNNQNLNANYTTYNTYNRIVYGSPYGDSSTNSMCSGVSGVQHRYLGYNQDGGFVTNNCFPNDATSGNPPENWNHHPVPGASASWAMHIAQQHFMDSAQLQGHGATNLTVNGIGGRSYARILTPPTWRSGGSVRIEHGSLPWYATFYTDGMGGVDIDGQLEPLFPSGQNEFIIGANEQSTEISYLYQTEVSFEGHAQSSNVEEYYISSVSPGYASSQSNDYSGSSSADFEVNAIVDRSMFGPGTHMITVSGYAQIKSIFDDIYRVNISGHIPLVVEPFGGDAYVEAEGLADPGEVEYVGQDIDITVHVDGHLEDAEDMDVAYWDLYAKKQEDDQYRQIRVHTNEHAAETTFDFHVPSESILSDEVWQIFDVKAKAFISSGLEIEGSSQTSTLIWEGSHPNEPPPPEPRDPIAILHVGPSFYWPQTVQFDDASFHPDAPDHEIISRSLTVDGQSVSMNHNFPRVTSPQTKQARLRVTDNNNLSDTDTKTFRLLPTTPTADFFVEGARKENRALTIDVNPSIAATDVPSAIAAINFSKTEYTITPMSPGIDPDGIKKRTDSDPTRQKFLVREAGEYMVTVTVTNEFNETSNPVSEIIEVQTDDPPEVNFTVDSPVQLREDDGVARIRLTDQSASNDDDYIQHRVWYVEYDDRNAGEFRTFEGSRDILSDANEKEVIYETDRVGHYRFGLMAVEGFGQETLEEFIRDEHYQRSETITLGPQLDTYMTVDNFNRVGFEKVVEINNAPPTIDFEFVQRNTVDVVLDFGGLAEAEQFHLTDPAPAGGTYDHFYQVLDQSNSNRLAFMAANMQTNLNTKGIDASIQIDSNFELTVPENYCIRDEPYQQQVFDGYEYKAVTNSQSTYSEPGWTTISSTQTGGQYDRTRRWRSNTALMSTISPPPPNPPAPLAENGYWAPDGPAMYHGIWDRSGFCSDGRTYGDWLERVPTALQSWINLANDPDCTFSYSPYSRTSQYFVWVSSTEFEHSLRRSTYRWETRYRDVNCPSGHASQEYFDQTVFIESFEDQTYRSDADRHYFRFDNIAWSWLENNNVLDRMIAATETTEKEFHAYSVWNNRNQALTIADINDGSYNSYFEPLASQHVSDIRDMLMNRYLLIGDEQNITIVLGEELDYTLEYDDLEGDPELEREWRFTHDYTEVNGRTIDNQPEGTIAQSGFWVDGPLQYTDVGTYVLNIRSLDDPVYWSDDRFIDYRKWSDEEIVREYFVYIHRAPIADFYFQVDVSDNNRLDLDPAPSYDPDFEFSRDDQGIVAETWSYQIQGNDTTYVGQPDYLNLSETYQVTLEVEDVDGAFDSVTKAIGDLPPIALFDVQQVVTTDTALNFVDRSYSPMGLNLIQHDVTVREQEDSTILWSGIDFPESFDSMTLDEGEYLIGLVVHDELGRTSQLYEQPIEVRALEPPVSLFDLSDEAEIGQIAVYEDQSYDPNNYSLINYSWTVELLDDDDTVIETWQSGYAPTDFRNFAGTNGEEEVTYRVTQIVHNAPPFPLSSLQSAPYSQEILVKEGLKAPYAYFTSHPNQPYEGHTFVLDPLASYDLDGTVEVYEWTIEGPNGNIINSTERFPNINNAILGDYQVILHVYDNDGLRSEFPAVRIVSVVAAPPNVPPVSQFMWDPLLPHLGQEIILNPDASYDPDGEVVAWEWNIEAEDGTTWTSIEDYPEWIAGQAYYDVTLIVTDDDGQQSMPLTQRIEVNIAVLIPLVTHTENWSNYWESQGHDRDVNLFKAGEKFMIRLRTTPATYVWGRVTFSGSAGVIDLPSRALTIVEQNAYEMIWEAELWQDNFASIPPGEYLFEFWGMHPITDPSEESYGPYIINIEGDITDQFHRNL